MKSWIFPTWNSLRGRALLAVLITLGLGASLFTRGLREGEKDRRARQGAEVTAVVSSVSATLNLATKEISSYLDAFAREADPGDAAACNRALRLAPRFTSTLETIRGIAVLRQDQVTCQTGNIEPPLHEPDGSLKLWSRRVPVQLQSVGPIDRTTTGSWTVILARQLPHHQGSLFAYVSLSKLNAVVFDGVSGDALFTVVDTDGRTLLRSIDLESRAGRVIPLNNQVEGVSMAPRGLPFVRNADGTATVVQREPVISPDTSGVDRVWDTKALSTFSWIVFAGVPYQTISPLSSAAEAASTALPSLALAAVLLWLVYSLTRQVSALNRYVVQVSTTGNMLPPAQLASEFAPLVSGFRSAFDLRKRAEIQLEQINDELLQRVESKIADLRKADAFRDAVMETANDVVLVVNDEGRIVAANSGVESVLGFARSSMIGKTLDETIMPPEFQLAHHEAFGRRRRLTDNLNGRRAEFPVVRKDGSRISAEFSISTTRIGGQFFAVGFLRDITARQQQEQALKEAVAASSSAAKAKSDFLAAMSHEIRTPLNGIMGMLDLVLDAPDTSARNERLAVARGSAQALLQLLNGILDYSRLDAGRVELANDTFAPRALLHEVVDITSDLCQAKGIAVTCHIDPGISERMLGDQTRLRQVLLNLGSNAAKFTERGRITFEAHGTESGMRIAVADTGIGIPFDRLAMIFEPFTQADSSMTRRFGGSGLGLAIVKALVHLMGGTVTAESVLGSGSTFIVEVPLKAAATEEHAKAGQFPAHLPSRILVVDDDLTSQMVASDTLLRAGHHCVTALTGEQVVTLVRDELIDLVLMDCRMPVVDGLTATRLLREAGFQGPIIAVTAHASERDRLSCLDAGMNDFLAKPVSPARLASTVSRWLGSPPPAAQAAVT